MAQTSLVSSHDNEHTPSNRGGSAVGWSTSRVAIQSQLGVLAGRIAGDDSYHTVDPGVAWKNLRIAPPPHIVVKMISPGKRLKWNRANLV
jgi:hypothetical protein